MNRAGISSLNPPIPVDHAISTETEFVERIFVEQIVQSAKIDYTAKEVLPTPSFTGHFNSSAAG